MDVNDSSGAVVDAAMKVHTVLGPGLLEGAYEGCLVHELRKRGHLVVQQLALPVLYDGICIDRGYRIDLLVNGAIVVEVKALGKLAPVHSAQLLSYLRLGDYKVGLVINFNVAHLRDGNPARCEPPVVAVLAPRPFFNAEDAEDAEGTPPRPLRPLR